MKVLIGQGLGLWLSRCHPWEQIQEQCVLHQMVVLVPVSLLPGTGWLMWLCVQVEIKEAPGSTGMG